jgi:UDP-2,3-diacylglucosamine pyrophosphatase LpxH
MVQERPEGIKLVLSDLHIGTGLRRGEANVYEDFHDDARLADFLEFYSTGEYGDLPVELILNGDIFDLLKVDVEGKFPEEISEAMSEAKLRRCLEGHPGFLQALRRFLERPQKTVTYLPGNHDIDLFLPGVQELFLSTVAPNAELRKKLRVISDSDCYHLPDGIQIQHGHQLEAMNRFDHRRFTHPGAAGEPVLNLPWGSIFVLRVINPLKLQRPDLDRIFPFKLMVVWGMIFDLRFTLKLVFRILLHFLRTRFINLRQQQASFLTTLRILREELARMDMLEHQAKRLLRRSGQALSTIICGHTHGAKVRRFGSKLYVNTGTWMKMIRLDLEAFGQPKQRTYARIEYRGGKALTRLMQWHGRREATEEIFY